MMETKSFSFSYEEYTVNALAYLYLDGSVKAIEIEHIWLRGKDLLAIYRSDGRWEPYVRAWMKEMVARMKEFGMMRLQQLLTDATSVYYEYDFL